MPSSLLPRPLGPTQPVSPSPGQALQTTALLPGHPASHPAALGKGTKPTCFQCGSQELWGGRGRGLTQLGANEGRTPHQRPGVPTASRTAEIHLPFPRIPRETSGQQNVLLGQENTHSPGASRQQKGAAPTVGTRGFTDSTQISNSSSKRKFQRLSPGLTLLPEDTGPCLGTSVAVRQEAPGIKVVGPGTLLRPHSGPGRPTGTTHLDVNGAQAGNPDLR